MGNRAYTHAFEVAVSVVAVACLTLAGGTVAWAGGGAARCCGGDGQSTGKPPDSKAELARARAKERDAAAYRDEKLAVRSVEPYAAMPGAYLGASGSTLGSAATSGITDLVQSGQSKSWWCGPATAGMIVRQHRRDALISTITSRYNTSHTLSQTNLARPTYLDAVSEGTYRTDMRRGLNRWMWGKDTAFFSVTSNPTPARFEEILTYDIDSKHAFAVAAIERANYSHYNGHPANRTVDHWVTAYGYANWGNTTRFADSATTLWLATQPYFTYTSSTFVRRWVQPSKAVVW